MSASKRRFTAAFLTVLLALTPAARAYTDTDNTWAAQVIEKASQYGLMNGYTDGRFGVGEDMTRAQFVTVLARMFGWELRESPDETLSDVNAHWAKGSIYAAAEHGAIDAAGTFRPDDPISRMEMARMLVRALGYGSLAQSLSDVDLPFDDVTEDRGYAAIAYDLGIITGASQNGQLKFLPNDSAPREQAAAMLVRCYERYFSQTQWRHGFYANSSYSQLGYTDALDAVSVGWAQLQYGETDPFLNDAAVDNNGWIKPQGSELVTDYLAERSIPCNLNIFASASVFSRLVEEGKQDRAVSLLAAAAAPYAGLTIDFEGLKTDRREDFTAFMTTLRAALPADRTLYVCVQPDTWFGGFDYRSLGELCDKVILMAHDYQWASIPDYYLGTDNTHCPVTPFDQVYTALRHITDPETGVQDRSKLALAISFNTTGFHVDENGLLLDTTFYHPAAATISKRLEQPDTVRTWDEESRNPYIEYTTEDGEHYKLWYEDAQSVTEKLQLARMFGVTGLSVWRLGTIPDFSNHNVWQVLSTF